MGGGGSLFAGYLWAVCRSSPAGLRTASASTAGTPGPALHRSGCHRRRSYCGQSCGRKTGGRERWAVLGISTSAGFSPPLHPKCQPDSSRQHAPPPRLTPSPSLHLQLLSPAGSRRFRPIQNQCCSWSSGSDSLQGARGKGENTTPLQTRGFYIYIQIYIYNLAFFLFVCFQSPLSPQHPKAGAQITGMLAQG